MAHGEILKNSMIIKHARFSLSTVQRHLTVRLGLGFLCASSKK